jgi:hypothetical protein
VQDKQETITNGGSYIPESNISKMVFFGPPIDPFKRRLKTTWFSSKAALCNALI